MTLHFILYEPDTKPVAFDKTRVIQKIGKRRVAGDVLRIQDIDTRHQSSGIPDLYPIRVDKYPDVGTDNVIAMGNGIDKSFAERTRGILLDPDPPRPDNQLDLPDLPHEIGVYCLDHLPHRTFVLPTPGRFIILHSDHTDLRMRDIVGNLGEEERTGIGEPAPVECTGTAKITVLVFGCDLFAPGLLNFFEEPVDIPGICVNTD